MTLYILCLGVLMIVLDTTIVTVALPSIIADLRLSGSSLSWLLNAYMFAYGGFLLLGGRLGDVYGGRRLLLAGLALFSIASLACALSHTESALLISRAVQGIGGATVATVSLSLIMSLFPGPAQRARALSLYGFVCAVGGGVGELLGGILTKSLSWHWIFLVNVPLGAAMYVFCSLRLPRDTSFKGRHRLDIVGAATATIALTLFTYVVANGSKLGWLSPQSKASLGLVAILALLFLANELRTRDPLIPLSLFRSRAFAAANTLAVLWSSAMIAWFVISALYLQGVLHYDPLQVGLAFLPAEVIMATLSVGLSAPMVTRFGIRASSSIGLLLSAAGLTLFARAPIDGTFIVDVLPAMLLLGMGAGLASTPLLLAGMRDIQEGEFGVASGVVSTSFVMGGAIGLAILASVAEVHTRALVDSGLAPDAALIGGYHFAFLTAAIVSTTAAILAAITLAPKPDAPTTPSRATLPKASRDFI